MAESLNNGNNTDKDLNLNKNIETDSNLNEMPEADAENLIMNNGNEIQSSEKERELLDLLFSLENEKKTLVDEFHSRMTSLKKELEETRDENDKLKKKTNLLEQTLCQSELSGNNTGKNKVDQEELLTRAKMLLFEKTKACKQQERQSEMLKTQVDAVKEVLNVTKEMLKLKMAEVEHTESRLESTNLKSKAERERSLLIEKKLEISKDLYDKLKQENETQKHIFKELKGAYEAKIKILSDALENPKVKS